MRPSLFLQLTAAIPIAGVVPRQRPIRPWPARPLLVFASSASMAAADINVKSYARLDGAT